MNQEAVSAAISSAVEDVQPNIPMIAGEAFNAGESAIRMPYEALMKAVGLFIRRATAEECFGCGAPIHHGAGHEVGCAVVSLYVALESPGSRS